MLKKPISKLSLYASSPRNSKNTHTNFTLPETRLSAEHLYTDIVGLSLLVVIQFCFQKLQSPTIGIPSRKQNLTWNSYSRSFKVTYFGINGKPTRDSYRHIIMLKFPKIQPAKALKIAAANNPTRLTPPVQGTPMNICINLILPETTETGLHYCHWYYGSIFIQVFLWWAPKDPLSATEYVTAIQGHWNIGTDRKHVYDFLFLLVISSNLGPILHCFWDTATYWLKTANFSYPTLI